MHTASRSRKEKLSWPRPSSSYLSRVVHPIKVDELSCTDLRSELQRWQNQSKALRPPQGISLTSNNRSSSNTKLGYHYLITHAMYVFLTPMVGVLAAQASTFSLQDLFYLWDRLRFNLISVVLCSTLLVFLSTLYFFSRPKPVYLVDFACYKPEDARKCTRQRFVDLSRLTGTFTQENLEFREGSSKDPALGKILTFPRQS
ncbi:hypothetical protein HPP92_005167 [Vanilla planifolia]|uniref:FAE domain-containing protein n=1 Tax=Vanilla planifolia TaxID=51239 RepID=A0A835V8U0_VANPL|nr:hypothetical protein HPP92_005167 [Vanilla planifolia]